MKRPQNIIIIGGGIAGLSAGIYAQRYGLQSVLLERHTLVGGECTGWDRQGYHLDNCIHWMVGTQPGSDMYQLWEELGALGPHIPLVPSQAFIRFCSADGRSYTVWNNLDRMQQEMIDISPADAPLIRRLVADIKTYACIQSVTSKPAEQRSFWSKAAFYWHIRRAILPHIRYSKISITQLANQFQSPFLRSTMLTYLPGTFYAEALLYMYAFVATRQAGIPVGGSRAMALRMAQRYESLGGQIRCSAEAHEILVRDGQAYGVRLKNGEILEADAIVAACDPHVTLHQLLGNRYPDAYFEQRYQHPEQYPLYSHACLYFAAQHPMHDFEADTVAFQTTQPFIMAGRQQQTLLVKHFQYEPSFAPQGRSVIQVMILQNESDYDYFQHLRDTDLAAYRAEKQRIANYVSQQLCQRFPEVQSLQMLDFTTSYSLTRFCRAYKGCYMPFVTQPGVPRIFHNGRIKGLHNLVLAGQWLQPPGGLINAAITGKFAIQRLLK